MKINRGWMLVLRCSAQILLVACALVVAGCAGQPPVGYVNPTKSGCCSSLSEINFRLITPGNDMDVSITADSPTFTFAAAPEHFVALKLPANFAATTIQIKSYLSTDYLPNATALIPEFIFLNANNVIVGKAPLANVRVAGEFWRGGVFSGSSLVPSGTQHIVMVAGKGNSSVPAYPSANGRLYNIPLAALGEISLRLFGDPTTK